MLDAKLYLLQRVSALVMVPLVLGHIAVMIYAVGGGLTAAEILARTQGSALWALFYGCFVISVSIHAAIGLRTVAFEWLGLRGVALSLLAWGFGALSLWLGARAVFAVILS